MCAALVRHKIGYTIVRWIRATQEGRLAAAALNGSTMRDVVSRGCPQGGVLSPLLWCLFVDDLIARLNGGSIHTQGYTDDIRLLVVGKFPNTISGLMQRAHNTVETWCDEVGLSANPDKNELVDFTRKRKLLASLNLIS